jgi:hypothetical protein
MGKGGHGHGRSHGGHSHGFGHRGHSIGSFGSHHHHHHFSSGRGGSSSPSLETILDGISSNITPPMLMNGVYIFSGN